MREADEARRIAGYLARLNISRSAQMYILRMAEDMVREHEREKKNADKNQARGRRFSDE